MPPVLRAEISWRPVGIFAGAVVLLFGVLGLTRYLSSRQLREQALSLSSEIIALAEERNRQTPPEGQPNWDVYTRRLGQFTEQTGGLYSQRFELRVTAARKEFARRGLIDEELDKFYLGPKSPIAVRTVGERLEYLAKQLD